MNTTVCSAESSLYPALLVLFLFTHFPSLQFEAGYEILLTLSGWAQYAYQTVIDMFKT